MKRPVLRTGRGQLGRAERDLLTLGIAMAAIVLFVATGSNVVGHLVRHYLGVGSGPDRLLVSAMLLNIALIIFGWRRYKQLSQEIEERRKAEAHARHLAESDPLTGCLNRRTINALCATLIEGSHGDQAVAVLMIDFDNFKSINDYHGHATGDQILVESARRLQELMPPSGTLARLGGDEFACVIPCDGNRPQFLNSLATAIQEAFAAPIVCDASRVQVTASIGLALSSQLGEADRARDPARSLMHMADIAMYQAKQQGRNRSYWYESSLEDEVRFHRELEAGIRHGIDHREFVPYYEQQIDLETGQLTGFEMLARWHSPAMGEVSPEIFIPVAESIGAIAELSQVVIEQALVDARDWDQSLTLSVNISPVQLRDPWFAQKLLKMLVAANFPPQRLEIEITESCLHENLTTVRTVIASLKNQGIRVSLDDFGTGYSSLAQLRHLPFDRIKIDRSFVTDMPESDDNAAIVHAIALLGRGLGMPITVEGIESDDVLRMLRQYGNIKGQGYLYGRPQPASVVRNRLAELSLLADAPAPREAAKPRYARKA